MTPSSLSKGGSMHQKQPPANVATAIPAATRAASPSGPTAPPSDAAEARRVGEQGRHRASSGMRGHRVVRRTDLTLCPRARPSLPVRCFHCRCCGWAAVSSKGGRRCGSSRFGCGGRSALALGSARHGVGRAGFRPRRRALRPRSRSPFSLARDGFIRCSPPMRRRLDRPNIFDQMLDYDYLVRPVQLVPRALEALPKVEDGGRTFVCRVRQGHRVRARSRVQGPAARAHRRGLRVLVQAPPRPAAEVAVGVAARGQAHGRRRGPGRREEERPLRLRRAKLPGLQVVDRHTLRIRLKAPDYRFAYVLAVPNRAPWRARSSRPTGRTSGRTRWARGRTSSRSTSAARASCSRRSPTFRRVTYAPSGPVPHGAPGDRVGAQGPPAAASPGASRSRSSRRARRAGSPSSTASST